VSMNGPLLTERPTSPSYRRRRATMYRSDG
jgi:hypothetical protein